jgi:hypothetical protein
MIIWNCVFDFQPVGAMLERPGLREIDCSAIGTVYTAPILSCSIPISFMNRHNKH